MDLDVKGNPGNNNTFQDTHLDNVGSYNPNATHVINNVYMDDVRHQSLLETADGEVMDMYYLSGTKPSEPTLEIPRDIYIDQCEDTLEDHRMMFISGKEGVGLTTLMSQFAIRHHNNCVSYFYKGHDLISIDPEVIEDSILSQLLWYVFGGTERYEWASQQIPNVKSLYQRVLRKINQSKEPLYFVFDGFDNIPPTKVEGVKRLFEDILWEKARYVFSGNPAMLKKIIPEGIKWEYGNGMLLPFTKPEVDTYFQEATPKRELNEGQLAKLYEITRGNAHRMDIILNRFIAKNKLDDLFSSDYNNFSDLYAEDYNSIFDNEEGDVYKFFSVLVFADFPLPISLVNPITDIGKDDIYELIKKYDDFVCVKNGIIGLREEGFHRYLRTRLNDRERETQLKIVGVLVKLDVDHRYGRVIPSLYKSLNQTENLINYLNSENVRGSFIQRQSQASINEHCDLGYEACEKTLEKHLPTVFRFALNKTFSREIEKNQLWDHEVEALLSVGRLDEAMLLADNVYLKEERLKYYLVIAAKKKDLHITEDEYAALKEGIDQLLNEIDFENIPNKAVELAKLLLPIDEVAAIGIIDKVVMKHKLDVNTDRLYSLFSLAAQPVESGESMAKRDLASQRIVNEDLRKFTRAAQGLFADSDVESFLRDLDKLPKASQKLQMIQFWLPVNEDKKGIGKVVLTAIQLMVKNSNTDVPKAKVLNSVCHAMDKMTVEQMEEALPYIDGMGDSIKFPTFDYVDAELTIIEALHEKLPLLAKDRLWDLYVYINEQIKDEGIKLTGLSKILGRYSHLGDGDVVKDIIGTTVDLQDEIVKGVRQLLSKTAYHIKVVEGPLDALVCEYPPMIDEIIDGMNTEERKSKAYAFAATQYLLNQDDDKIELDYFFRLLSKTYDTDNDRLRPLLLLTDILAHSRKLDNDKILPSLKTNLTFIEHVEQPDTRAQMLMRVYIWVKKHFPEDKVAERLKVRIGKSWNELDGVWHKISIGFYLAKSFAPFSKEDAEKMIAQCEELKKLSPISTSSCEDAFYESLDIYTHSLCQLIKLNLCSDDILRQFSDDVNPLLSPYEKIRLWGLIALQYSLAGNSDKFQELTEIYIPGDLTKLPIGEQKFTVQTISSVLFLQNSERFFTLMASYDEPFMNVCMARVCKFIIKKQVFYQNNDIDFDCYDLSPTDYYNLLSLLSHSTDDDTYYNIINIISKSIVGTYQGPEPISSESKKTIINRAKDLVVKNLPTLHGIRHDGYKIVCLAALNHVGKKLGVRDKERVEQQIMTVSNTADRAFLYFDLAPYFSSRSEIDYMINKGIEISESLSFTYDKEARLEMAIIECAENNLGGMIREVAHKAFKSLGAEGSLDDNRHLIDTIYQHKPEVAAEIVDGFDQDPGRMVYKKRLIRQIDSAKKIDEAKKDSKKVNSLTPSEQRRYFHYQLRNLLDDKGQILDINDVFSFTLPYIFRGNISDTMDAVLYLLKMVGKKEKQSKNQKSLLMTLHDIFRNNLRLVLSLAAGTKEKIDYLDNRMMNNHQTESANFIPVGGYKKAEEYLINWYRSVCYNELVIIDPFLKPQALGIIKKFTDENTKLHIRILTHLCKDITKDDYDFEWRKISRGIQTSVDIDFVCYKDKPEDCPLHDRYMICHNEDTTKRVGIILPSLNTLGMKETSINPIDEALISDILLRQTMYSHELMRVLNGRELCFEHTKLE